MRGIWRAPSVKWQELCINKSRGTRLFFPRIESFYRYVAHQDMAHISGVAAFGIFKEDKGRFFKRTPFAVIVHLVFAVGNRKGIREHGVVCFGIRMQFIPGLFHVLPAAHPPADFARAAQAWEQQSGKQNDYRCQKDVFIFFPGFAIEFPREKYGGNDDDKAADVDEWRIGMGVECQKFFDREIDLIRQKGDLLPP